MNRLDRSVYAIYTVEVCAEANLFATAVWVKKGTEVDGLSSYHCKKSAAVKNQSFIQMIF